MTAKIDIHGISATLDGWVWSSPNKSLEGLLNAMLDPHGPGGQDPDPEYHAAVQAATELKGRLVSSDPMPPYDPEAVY